jgi:hypothetical protein
MNTFKVYEHAPLLVVRLGKFWDRPFADLPKDLHWLVQQACAGSNWDEMPEGLRRQAALEFSAISIRHTERGQIRISGTIPVPRVDDKVVAVEEPDPYSENSLIGADDFEKITGCGIGRHGDFTVTRQGVYPEPIDDHTLGLLCPEARFTVLAVIKHQLTFPCSNAELVDFVGAVGFPFTVPDGFGSEIEVPVKVILIKCRIATIVQTALELGYSPLAIPWGGKAAIERECLDKHAGAPNRFTAGTFKRAWQVTRDKGLIDVVDAEIYRGR